MLKRRFVTCEIFKGVIVDYWALRCTYFHFSINTRIVSKNGLKKCMD